MNDLSSFDSLATQWISSLLDAMFDRTSLESEPSLKHLPHTFCEDLLSGKQTVQSLFGLLRKSVTPNPTLILHPTISNNSRYVRRREQNGAE